nr:hypothetical protein [Mixta theicola]
MNFLVFLLFKQQKVCAAIVIKGYNFSSASAVFDAFRLSVRPDGRRSGRRIWGGKAVAKRALNASGAFYTRLKRFTTLTNIPNMAMPARYSVNLMAHFGSA